MSTHLQSGNHPDADQISAFVDHALPAHEREEMLVHLAKCEDCRETVALSLPAIETAPAPKAVKKSKPWYWSMKLLWPAAAAALTIVLLYIHNATNSHKAAVPGPEVARIQPAAPAKSENAPAGGAGGGAGSHSLAGRERVASGNAPHARAAEPPQEKPGNLPQGMGAGSLAANTTRRAGDFHLPGGAIAISMVTRGRQVLAIDDRNAVFLSNDGGASWIGVQVPWKGRAVKAQLISYPVTAAARGKAAGSGWIRTRANPGVYIGAANSSDAARFRAQKSLRQELKGSYQAPMNGTGATLTAPSPMPPPALTAPVPSAPATSQETLTGIIADRTGAVIPGASVAITNSANHVSKTAVTGADGRYRIDGLAPGMYQFEAQARGFSVTTLSDVQIAASSPNTTDVTLDVGAAAETVTVQATAPEMQTTSPEHGNNLIFQKQKSASRITPGRATPVFVITTDTGDHWTSPDGINWRRQ